MAVGDAHVFPGFFTLILTQLFFPKPPTSFLTCFCRDERRKYAGKKVLLNRGSNSQPPGYESDTLTTEQPGRIAMHVKCEAKNRRKESWLQTASTRSHQGPYSLTILRNVLSLFLKIFLYSEAF